jgi:predicted RNA-binding Zn ribbon-like protein
MQHDLLAMPWIGDDPVLAVANTVVLDDPARPETGHVDLLANRDARDTWRRKVEDLGLSNVALPELFALRTDVRSALDAVDRSAAVPEDALVRLNARAAAAPLTFALDPDGDLRTTELTDDAAARVARETIRTLGAAKTQPRLVRRCPAPGCGMFFVPGRQDQSWCTTRCGTRARAAKLRRRTAAQRGRRGA